MRCEAKILREQCMLEAGHGDDHESDSYYWSGLPFVSGRIDQANPFARA